MNQHASRDYCTTRVASQQLGLSPGTIQKMVEDGILACWKTSGGHRRILVSSIEAQLNLRNNAMPGKATDTISLIIAEDNSTLQQLYSQTIHSWDMPIALQLVGNGYDGLMMIGRHTPDLLIVDLMMPGIDGFEMIHRIRANPDLKNMDIIVVTGISRDEIAQRGGLPADITLYEKPIPFDQLHGYLQAKLMQRLHTTG
ncbi:MAG: response regulator [Nitrosomonadales bacterium]|jgi:excisionase family DNA binding protein